MKPLIRLTIVISVVFSIHSCSVEEVSMETLLNDIIDRESLTIFPEEEFYLEQFSSYDRASVAPGEEGWFANADYSRFIREENNKGRREFVLFDAGGPGAIVRWWMTFAGEGSYDGILRVYIDNNDIPVIEDNVLKVISGHLLAEEPLSSSVSPLTDYHRRGHNLYLPIPYARQCKITYECDAVEEQDGRIKPSIYYNINYRNYTGRIKMESFSMDVLAKNTELIKNINKNLLKDDHVIIDPATSVGEINPGDTLSLEIEAEQSAISRLNIRLDAINIKQSLRSTVLFISFDGYRTVWVPAGDFFGTGFNLYESNTWYSSVSSNGNMSSSWIMPFKNSATVNIINYGKQPVSCEIEAEVSEYKWKEKSMYFGASWHEYNRIESAGAKGVGGNDRHFDINYVDIDGVGIYAGDAITVFNTADAWWGEGDEKIFVDGESFPSCIGTGTEDYYGYAWCRPESFTHPFIAQPSGKGNFHPGMSVNMRYRVLDIIPFNSQISSNIELWHWAPTIMNYALTSYFYALPGFRINIEPDENIVKLNIPEGRSDIIKPELNDDGIIEGENLKIETSSGLSAESQAIASWDWSGKAQLWIRNGKPGSELTASFISKEEGRFNITGRFTMAGDYGISDYYINDIKALNLNAYSPTEKVVELDLGTFNINKGLNTLRIVIRGTDPSAKPSYMAGIDMLKLTK